MLNKIQAYIESNHLLQPSSKVITGLSGGADSVCLAYILKKLGYTVIAAHCNFHLRGGESDRDQQFVEDFCKKQGFELEIIDFDTDTYASVHKLGTEEAARELRYNWFESLRTKYGASAVCVAHHRDDSIETALLNLIRGAGIMGICGIRAKNGYVVRPLLCIGRKEIEKYLKDEGLTFVTDSTNLETVYNRNKVRNILIPEIEKIKPNFADTMTANMENFSAVAHIYNKVIEEQKERVLSYNGNTIYINLSKVQEFIEPETLLFELLKPYGIHPREISKLLTMETSKSVSTQNATLTIKRIKGERIILVAFSAFSITSLVASPTPTA
ncbi:MAG: tRNA lysidine(34) synthetase TilS [Paludibacteraceae bacterium]|nr:tRNA lysidine(34) synthetase TilS [Paludibacteraceae bacterium]